VTQLLLGWRAGDDQCLSQLIPLVDRELRQIAHRYMRMERPGHTLQTTALVNEAYLKLMNHGQADWQNRAHFFGIAAQLMRHILVDHARGLCRKNGEAARNTFRSMKVWFFRHAKRPRLSRSTMRSSSSRSSMRARRKSWNSGTSGG